MDSPVTSTADAPGRAPDAGSRRRLIGAGLVGLAGSLLPSLSSRASASAPPDDAATTTTAPPQRPTGDDVDLLGFAQSIELAAVQLYDAALASGSLGADVATVVGVVRASHRAYADSFSAMLGGSAPRTALASLVDAGLESFASGSDQSVASAALELENTAVATYTEMVGQLLGTGGSALLASILIVEARHAAVFADIAGETDLDTLLLTDADALEPEKG